MHPEQTVSKGALWTGRILTGLAGLFLILDLRTPPLRMLVPISST